MYITASVCLVPFKKLVAAGLCSDMSSEQHTAVQALLQPRPQQQLQQQALCTEANAPQVLSAFTQALPSQPFYPEAPSTGLQVPTIDAALHMTWLGRESDSIDVLQSALQTGNASWLSFSVVAKAPVPALRCP